MLRHALLALPVLALAACSPPVPDSGAGVGFESYSDYIKRRDGVLTGQAQGAQGTISTGTPISSETVSSAPIGAPLPLPPAATAPAAANPAATRGRADTIAGVQQQTGEMRQVSGGHAGISDEQDFDAVASRESIESDRQRREQQQAQYVVVQPEPLPQRTGAAGPNIVEYALSTRHAPGAQMYRRSGLRFTSPERACARYTSADLAQEAFLASGGPDRDPKGLDPDGDGFACGWDPRPFRAALQ